MATPISTNADLIRKAWKTGRKKITLDGRVFLLNLNVRDGSFIRDGEPVIQKEFWIVARPEDGAQVPIYGIERDHQGNSRVVVGK